MTLVNTEYLNNKRNTIDNKNNFLLNKYKIKLKNCKRTLALTTKEKEFYKSKYAKTAKKLTNNNKEALKKEILDEDHPSNLLYYKSIINNKNIKLAQLNRRLKESYIKEKKVQVKEKIIDNEKNENIKLASEYNTLLIKTDNAKREIIKYYENNNNII